VDIGAIVAPVQLEKIRSLVQQGVAEGATVWQPSWSCPAEGYFYPPTLCTDVAPAGTLAQIEIFGPVVVLMTFRTPVEAVALANNTRFGLAASVWTENINLALDIAPKVQAGTVWINCTNVFDAASGFGGYRESGFGREGGREGLWEYVKPSREEQARPAPEPAAPPAAAPRPARPPGALPSIDRTAKLYIGGKQVRPDQGYSLTVHGAAGASLGEVARGNRKDIRNAVEAAHRAAWSTVTAHLRAQVLYYIAENLSARHDGFTRRLVDLRNADHATAAREVDRSIERLFDYAAWADKYDGAVHHTPFRNVTLAMPEPIGVLAIVCPDDAPLLGFISAVMPAVAMGNAVVVVPSELAPLAATDFYHVLDGSDLPGGVINIVTGLRAELTETLAAHDDVDGFWYFAGDAGGGVVERLSAGNMKRTWVTHGYVPDWWDPLEGSGVEFLRHATQVKNIWVPYGE
jgi:aldehyde dehydrogenase (NAD+)